jgi:hypothetical protein
MKAKSVHAQDEARRIAANIAKPPELPRSRWTIRARSKSETAVLGAYAALAVFGAALRVE